MNETKKISYDVKWQERYADHIKAPQEAMGLIKPGQRVFIGTGCAQPRTLVNALVAHALKLVDVEIIHLLTFGEAPYAESKLAPHFRVNSFFIAENVRGLIQEGLGDYTPIFLSDIPRLFSSGQLPLDAALIQVSPPDDQGNCSLGISVDIVKAAASNASLVIAQVNPQMPRALGNSFINVFDIDVLVPMDEPLIELTPLEPNETTVKIGQNVAALVDDGSTLELGIGRIPCSLLRFLKDKKNLGVHTEMLTDHIIDLMESGVINGAHKTTDRGKVVTSFALGTKRLYDYIDNNSAFAFHPTEYVNDPFVIAQQNKMVAINVALEVDLTGQVCADSIGNRFFSGIGGQVDFNRGAARCPNGKAIIALPSTAKQGSISRIVSRLSPGAGVVTTRGDVHYVVTEYGVAYLHGKNVQERAMALITIAHPDFREQLLRDAVEARYIRQEFSAVEDKIIIGPQELRTTHLLADGTMLYFRPIHPTDVPRMQDLFYKLSEATIYYRFMSRMKRVPRRQIQNFVYIDHRKEVSIVATVPEAYGEDIIGIGNYYLDATTNRAEVAFITRDDWQNRGIGSFLLAYLIKIARRNGIRGFTAEVLRDNKPMQAVLYKSGTNITTRIEEGVVHFEMDFA